MFSGGCQSWKQERRAPNQRARRLLLSQQTQGNDWDDFSGINQEV
jgi:hypothetical protein